MDRIRELLQGQQQQPYEPLERGDRFREDDEQTEQEEGMDKPPFVWFDYIVFFLLGVAMLWAWNMFLAAGPYFQHRFSSNETILHNFQSAELTISTVVNLGAMLVLAEMQARANYPKRIIASLGVLVVTFSLLAISTKHFLSVSAGAYFVFMMLMVGAASFGTALCQNGVFAYVTGFGREEYTQAIMTGQGLAGVLPCIFQIVSALDLPANEDEVAREEPNDAFRYFILATLISLSALAAYLLLLFRYRAHPLHKTSAGSVDDLQNSQHSLLSGSVPRAPVPLLTLLRKLFWLATAVFLTFAVTMIYPIFTQEIQSVRSGTADTPRLLQPDAFIPLAFLFWNAGDLLGRILPAVPALSLTSHPRAVFALAAARIVFLPLYLLCNVKGRGAVLASDAVYLVLVQLLFGLSNGFVGSTCMMGAVEYVGEDEREAAGGFMGLCLVSGLTAGSLLSFVVSWAL
ncbi:uncharacterized protein K452DRAFT_325483 [Aplosporella prunicola CBS 121167]|uniref:Nucleoside transporter n=1 Tax=Aplosporella prunicola CBS 121167 TaxID=1176127 RepID=A0A6A6BJE9_9PEZI|nr:uncharacterized protein K452DRAFT_325483 [Aplosporella prunicola CBS 121167]KAF2144290.1 hypothetical protein K452DRAFT_325483 [Aplosporella prunicola CBS 121167]